MFMIIVLEWFHTDQNYVFTTTQLDLYQLLISDHMHSITLPLWIRYQHDDIIKVIFKQ